MAKVCSFPKYLTSNVATKKYYFEFGKKLFDFGPRFIMASEPLRRSKRLAKGDSETEVTKQRNKQPKQETTNPSVQTAEEDDLHLEKPRCNWATKFSGMEFKSLP